MDDAKETFPGELEPILEIQESPEIIEQPLPASGTSAPLGILPEVTTENQSICGEPPTPPEPPTPIPCSPSEKKN